MVYIDDEMCALLDEHWGDSLSLAERILASERVEPALVAAMISALSEELWCAGWLDGIERDVFYDFDDFIGISFCEHLVHRAAIVRARQALRGGWVMYVSKEHAPDGRRGVHSLNSAEWKRFGGRHGRQKRG